MPDTYFTRKEAIAHGEAIDPITREEALIQKDATPLSVKDAALYALKDGGSTPSDFRIIWLRILGANSLDNHDLSGDKNIRFVLNYADGDAMMVRKFTSDEAGGAVFEMPISIPNAASYLTMSATSSTYLCEPQLTYAGLSYIGENRYSITNDDITIYVGARGGK